MLCYTLLAVFNLAHIFDPHGAALCFGQRVANFMCLNLENNAILKCYLIACSEWTLFLQ